MGAAVHNGRPNEERVEGRKDRGEEMKGEEVGDMEGDERDAFAGLSAEEALRGVDVETEADDDSDEEALPTFGDGKLAPALADMGDDETLREDSPVSFPAAEIPGIDVETEEDDDSDEEPLPLDGDEVAPALFASHESIAAGGSSTAGSADTEINQQVDDFFADGGLDFADDMGDAAASEESLDQPVSPALSEIDSAVDEKPDDEAIGAMEDRLETFLSEDSEPSTVSDESFSVLKANVDSLREEISAAKIGEIESALQQMKEALADKPIEKTLAHLIGAVVNNIGKRSGEFDDEAVELLHSVFGNLEKIRSAEVDQNQALIVLANETANILQWQQRMLSN